MAFNSAASERIVTFIHQPDDFANLWNETKDFLSEIFCSEAAKFDLRCEFIPARDVLPVVDSKSGPSLLHNGVNLLRRRRCFVIAPGSTNPQADRYLQGLYECVSYSDSILLNRTTETRDFVSRDKLAITNYAAALKIPHIKSLIVPHGKYSKAALEYLDLLGAESWILKPREVAAGRGVLRLKNREELVSALELVSQSQFSYLIQPHVENATDLRVYCVNGEILTPVSAEIATWCRQIAKSLDADFLCFDWLITTDGPVLNGWSKTIDGLQSLSVSERSQVLSAFFKYLSGQFDAPAKRHQGNQRCLPAEVVFPSEPSGRVFTHIYEPDDAPAIEVDPAINGVDDRVTKAADRNNLKMRMILSRDVVPVATFPPKLMYRGEDLLQNKTCFTVSRVSADPAAFRHLQGIYEIILQSRSVLLNDTIACSESLEQDKFAQTCFAFAQNAPIITTYLLPFGSYAKKIFAAIGVEQGPWILKPRELSSGQGVLKVDSDQQLRAAIDIVAQTGNSYILQPLIENLGDFRIYTAHGKVFGAAVRRPVSGGYLSNLSRGGGSEPEQIPGEMAKLIRQFSDELHSRYFCIDWLLKEEDFVFNEFSTALTGLNLNTPKLHDSFFGWVGAEMSREQNA